MEVSGQLHASAALPSGKNSATQGIRGLVGHTTGRQASAFKHVVPNVKVKGAVYRFVFRRSWIQVSAWKPIIMTKVCSGFLQSLPINAGLTSKSGPLLLPSTTVPVSYITYYFHYD